MSIQEYVCLVGNRRVLWDEKKERKVKGEKKRTKKDKSPKKRVHSSQKELETRSYCLAVTKHGVTAVLRAEQALLSPDFCHSDFRGKNLCSIHFRSFHPDQVTMQSPTTLYTVSLSFLNSVLSSNTETNPVLCGFWALFQSLLGGQNGKRKTVQKQFISSC